MEGLNESKFLRMDLVKFVEDTLQKILPGPFLKNVTQMKFSISNFWLATSSARKPKVSSSNLAMNCVQR